MKTALTDLFILSGKEDMIAEAGKAVLIDGEIISDIVDADKMPDGYRKISLGGRYLLPGLVDLHVHMPSDGNVSDPDKKTDYKKLCSLLKIGIVKKVLMLICKKNAKATLYSGTTSVRAVGGIMDFDSRLRDMINSGKAVGPRMLVADYAVSVEGGHMTGSVAMPAHSAEEAARMVRDIAKQSPDLIKLMITGGTLDATHPGEPGELKMPPEYVKAACDTAHALGFKVAAHVESTEGMKVALENGVDTVEHGGEQTDETLRMFKEKGAVLVGTVSAFAPCAKIPCKIIGMSEENVYNDKVLFEYITDGVKRCLAEGITVGMGTDCGSPFITHYDFWRELWCFCRYCGVSPAKAIHIATEENAKIAGIGDITGTVEKGKCADFLVVEKNPCEDITALRTPYMVVFRGKVISKPHIGKFRKVEKTLDYLLDK